MLYLSVSALKGSGWFRKNQPWSCCFWSWPVPSVFLLWLKGGLGTKLSLAFKGGFQENWVIKEHLPMSVLLSWLQRAVPLEGKGFSGSFVCPKFSYFPLKSICDVGLFPPLCKLSDTKSRALRFLQLIPNTWCFHCLHLLFQSLGHRPGCELVPAAHSESSWEFPAQVVPVFHPPGRRVPWGKGTHKTSWLMWMECGEGSQEGEEGGSGHASTLQMGEKASF